MWPDQIPVKFLKPVAESLTYIINSCIKGSYFPEAWKMAWISRIPKVNQPRTKQDYRPIPPSFNAYIKDLALFNDSIKGYSTAMTLLGIRDDIMRAMRRGEVTLMVLTDYSKAFDTVNFKSVIYKMYSMGFSQNFLRWILSYLMGLRQFVQIDRMVSGQLETKFGIP